MNRRNIQVRRVLVADQGIGARRVIRSVHEAGMEAVAVFGERDAQAPHVDEADYAVPLPDLRLRDLSTLRDSIIGAAMDSGCDAIHPGLGLLAQNPLFAEQVQLAGLLWMGLDARLLAVLQDRELSREIAARVGMRVIPSADPRKREEVMSLLSAEGEKTIARPVLGRGFAPVEPDRVDETLSRLRQTSLQHSGDARISLERWLGRSRHISVILVSDQHDNHVVVGEYESTLRWQGWKMLEEAPLEGMGPVLLEHMRQESALLARELRLEGLLVVTFLLTSDGRTYFLNTKPRLPAGHPVVEQVWGVDLVDAQIRVALGEPLGWSQSELLPTGAALSLRLLAIDPTQSSRVSTGRITSLKHPRNCRFDSGVRNGCEVVEPHLATLTFKAPTRQAVIVKSRKGVDGTSIEGVASNLPILKEILDRQDFWEGRVHGDILAESCPNFWDPPSPKVHQTLQ